MFNKLKNKYKFVYSENKSDNCCISAIVNETVICDSCHESVCLKCAFKIENVYLHRECSASLRRDIKLLETFHLQNTEAKATLIQDGWKFDISEIGDLKRSKPRCFVEINSNKFSAQITMFSSGECEATVLKEGSWDTIFFIYRVLDTEVEVRSFLQDFYSVLYEIQLSI